MYVCLQITHAQVFKSRGIFLISITLHTIWMMFLSYLWLNLPYSYESESKIMTVTNILKNVVLGVEEKPDKDSLLFVNISYDKMLIPRYDTDGFESGTVAITDRMALSRFLETINERQEYQFIILDVFFEDSTSYDSMLQAQVKNTKAFILPYHFDGGEERLKSHIKGWSGLADYNTDFGTFLKYSYIQHDTSRTVPLLLYEKFNKGYLRKSGPFYTSNGHLALNALTLDFPVRSFDVFTNDDSGYSSVHLCELMNTPPDFINALTKNKIIVIGDFVDRDLHATLYGTMAGPLIQLNAYLALVNGDHLLTWPLLIFIFCCYMIISWFLLSDKVLISNRWLEKLKKSKWGGFIFDFLKYAFVLVLINIFSYLLFDVHLNVLIIGVYIVIVEYIISWRFTKNVEYHEKR